MSRKKWPRFAYVRKKYYFCSRFATAIFDDAVLYPNPYIVVTKRGYTKHYYAGSERLATVIGTCGLDEMAIPFERLRHEKVNEIEDALCEGYKGHNPFRQLLSRQVETTDIGGNKKCELDYNCKPAILETLEITCREDILMRALGDNKESRGRECDIYYYHGDHLGSASWVTNKSGGVIAEYKYAPYGELVFSEKEGDYDERYKFTGKERDSETGYDYFGARYFWSALGHWLSVDPLADKYPGISPYAYCGWNPVNRIDPNGMDTLHFDAKGNYTHRVQSEGPHVGLWHKSNNSTREFRFQDPNDANRFMTDEEYLDNISNSGTLDRLLGIMPVSLSSIYKATRPSISDRLKGRYIAALSGKANGSMDYMRLNEPNYNMAGFQSYLMLVDGIPLAQQPYNMGNMLWGLKMHRLGFSLPACLLGAHAYTIYGGMTGKYTKIELDSFDDQCSIILGYMLWPGL